MKSRAKAGRIAGLVCAALLAFAAGGCSDNVRGDVQKTLPRPGGGVTALFARQETWEDYIYRVYMRKEEDGSTWSVFWADRNHEGPPDIKWEDADTLVIQMKCGDIGEYTNFFGYDLNGETKKVSIVLDRSRPCIAPTASRNGAK